MSINMTRIALQVLREEALSKWDSYLFCFFLIIPFSEVCLMGVTTPSVLCVLFIPGSVIVVSKWSACWTNSTLPRICTFINCGRPSRRPSLTLALFWKVVLIITLMLPLTCCSQKPIGTKTGNIRKLICFKGQSKKNKIQVQGQPVTKPFVRWQPVIFTFLLSYP